MIQRIQTVFLLLVIAVQLSSVFLPIAYFALPNNTAIAFIAANVQTNAGLMPFLLVILNLVLLALTIILTAVTVFLYKNRVSQMKWCKINIATIIMSQFFILFLAFTYCKAENIAGYNIFILFPVLSVIFTYLAFRSIRKDEKLIRSIDRIR